MRRDLAGAKDVQQAFFSPEGLSIPCMACQTFYQPAHDIGGDYYDFLSLLSQSHYGLRVIQQVAWVSLIAFHKPTSRY